MSLLRSVLKKNGEKTSEQVEGSGAPAPGPSFDPGALGTTSKRSSARSIAASSIRSASAASFKSVATTIASMVSFYSMLTGGSKIPKRRRPDILKFGAPPFVFRRPPPAQPVPGAERLPPLLSPFTAAHSVGEYLNTSGAEPRLCIVLFSHARVPEKKALYHDQAVVAGEIRMFLKKPRALDFIDVWFQARMDCNLEIQGTAFVQQKARVYTSGAIPTDDEEADVEESGVTKTKTNKKKLPAGTHVFPFSFLPIAQEMQVHSNEESERKNKGETRLDLPPNYFVSAMGGFSGQIDYKIGLNIEYSKMFAVDDIIDMPIYYLPRTRPIPRPSPGLPPLLPTREDWPYAREEIGGWTITPFGGRGRWDDDIVEVEGLLGTPYPPVYCWGETIPLSLTLWSTNIEALQALSEPDSIAVHFLRNEVYGADALAPRSASRRNRKTTDMGKGVMWRVDSPADDAEATAPDDVNDGALKSQLTLINEARGEGTASGSDTTKSNASSVKEFHARDDLIAYEEQGPQAVIVSRSTPESEDVADADADVDDALEAADAQPDLETTTSVQAKVDNPTTETPPEVSTPVPAIPPVVPLRVDGPLRPAPKPKLPPGAGLGSGIGMSSSKHVARPTRRSPLARVAATAPSPPSPSGLSESTTPDDPNLASPVSEGERVADGDATEARPPSPTPSEEEDPDQFPGEEDKGMIVQLRGELKVMGANGLPSFNWKYLNRNYMVKIVITHPRYLHISPNATGIYSETSIWVTSDPVDPTKPIPTSDEMISKAKAEAEAAMKAEEEADKDAALALSELEAKASLAKGSETETDRGDAAPSETEANVVTEQTPNSGLDSISEDAQQDADVPSAALPNLRLAGESTFTLSPDTASSSASFISKGSGSSSTASLIPSYEKKKGRAKSVFSFASSASTIGKGKKDKKSKSDLPEPEPYAPPTMPVQLDTLEYAHLPIDGEFVPLPHEALGADRRRLPLFRQPHTVGEKSHIARPIIANRIYSF